MIFDPVFGRTPWKCSLKSEMFHIEHTASAALDGSCAIYAYRPHMLHWGKGCGSAIGQMLLHELGPRFNSLHLWVRQRKTSLEKWFHC